MIKTRSIRMRGSTVFTMVTLLVVVLGSFSIWRLRDYHEISVGIRDRLLRNTQYIGDLNNFTSDLRTAEGTSLLAATNEQVRINKQQIEELDDRITLAQHSFEHIAHGDDEAVLYQQFQQQWLTYRQIAGEVMALSTTPQKMEAIDLYTTRSNAAYQEASDTLGALTELNVNNADTMTRRADAAYIEARLLTTIAVLLAGLTVTGGFLYLRRSIADPLLDLATSMRRLAANTMDIEIAGINRSDEIGEMARAVEVFRENAVDLAISQRVLADQASTLAQKLNDEQHLTQLQRNFLSMASHEFRTPLNVIDGHAQRLLSAVKTPSAADVTDRAMKIRSAVLRMTTVIDNLINSSRLLDGGAELQFQPTEVDIGQLLYEVCRLHREIMPAAQVSQHFAKCNLTVEGDQRLLFQAFSNLLSNAIKYSFGRGAIRITATKEGDCIAVDVEDQGVGIPEPDQSRLFERYYRGSNVSGIVGTGIGLYLVKTVIDLHGGEVGVMSRVGEGARFTVKLPIG
jgi:two-component system OmpR family sensor kinase